MDHNYNFSHANVNPYFIPTSFDSNFTNPALHNFNQPSMSDWFYLTQPTSQSQCYEQDLEQPSQLVIELVGYNSPKSYS